MKTRWMHLFAGVTMFVLCMSICTTTANATIIWQDNFDDLDDWTIFGYIYGGYGNYPVPIEGNFSAADGTLRVLDDDCNVARHDSDVTVGTWSFDMFVPDDDDGIGNIYVEFMSNGSSFIELGNGSFLAFGAWLNENKFVVWTIVGAGWSILASIHVDPLQGWHHIEVSRTNDANFYVYFNGNETPAASFDTTVVTSSIYLQFLCNNATGAAIDNLVVYNTPKVPPTTPTTSTTLPPINPVMIGLIGGIGVGVVILLVIIYRRRS